MTGTLYLVATPLGNLGDMTYRAVETLQKASMVVAEDTRRARILCEHFQVKTKLVSMPAFREAAQAKVLVDRLLAGDDLALVTDAGSPGISDPGTFLVQQAIASQITVVPIPGPCAAVAALAASGLATDRFYFVGFLPRKGNARHTLLASLQQVEATLVFYESPERIVDTLNDLREAWGDRQAVVARELTKIHEEFARGKLSQLSTKFAGQVRGEITLLLSGASPSETALVTDEAILAEVRSRLAAGEQSVKDIARDLAQVTGRSRSEIYALALKAREKND